MTLTIAIIANIGLMVALLAGLAYAMTRPARLRPHFAEVDATAGTVTSPRRHPAERPRARRTPVPVGS